MNKSILLLYTTPSQKKELEECVAVFKAILRKYRKSAVFSYMQLDLSPASYPALKELLNSKFEQTDAVIWHTNNKTYAQEKAFAEDSLGLYATEHFTAGQCIVCAAGQKSAVFNDNKLRETVTYDTKGIEKAVSLAVKEASCRKHTLVLCTDTHSLAGSILFREFEHSLGNEKHIAAQHISLNELIWQSIRRVPDCDVILTTENAAELIAMHLCAAMQIPTGYVMWHTDKLCIYRREIFPYEHLKCTVASSLLMAFSAILENEFSSKGAASWLRRSISLALEENYGIDTASFANEVIRHIDKPIRKRQVK